MRSKTRSRRRFSGRGGTSIRSLALRPRLFKQVNDRFGHQAGDRVLVASPRAVERMLRETDVFARVGSEAFAVLLPDANFEGRPSSPGGCGRCSRSARLSPMWT